MTLRKGLVKWVIFILLLVLVSILGGWLQYRGKIAPVVVQGIQVPVDTKNSIQANSTQLEGYLDRLSSMENCGEGIIDRNGLVSKGDLCFQKATYLYFVKKYEIYPYAEEQELLNNWGDSWTQREIARRMIEEEVTQLEKHWYTSVVVRKLGLPTYD